ncbi:MAG TPA: Mrp/NBP35 family ATP-binding protein [Proteiniclasticum sp.]|nr:Mrp/NBP35 family ATP-binding protein [Proteiniclasticum sp.]
MKCDLIKPKYGKIKHVVGVISGKGGVGKSTVTGVLAVQLRKLGYKVGVLDGDITGPSMPRFFGLEKERTGYAPTDVEDVFKFIPVETGLGIKSISMNFMIDEEEPLLWKGPVLGNVLVQLFTDTDWGELDYLLIDMPPGTGDVAMTIMEQFPVDYLVVVSTPQNMVSMIVQKVVNMAEKLEIPVKGVIQNMSYITCSQSGERMNVFSKNTALSQAEKMGLPLLAELPINPEFAEHLEAGQAERFAATNPEYDVIMEAFRNDDAEVYARNKAVKRKVIPFL